MSVPIRKPLSRKFNMFLFEYGRSPDLFNAILPSHSKRTVALKKTTPS